MLVFVFFFLMANHSFSLVVLKIYIYIHIYIFGLVLSMISLNGLLCSSLAIFSILKKQIFH